MALAKPLFAMALTALLPSHPSFATPTTQVPIMSTPQSTLSIPITHTQYAQQPVLVDGETAILTRYTRHDGRNNALGGEHFSTVIATDGMLKGFTHMSLEMIDKPLPSREKSEQIARAFLQAQAPDLLDRMEISWIDPHDEPLTVQQNGTIKTLTLTGMKVKARNVADGRWFWVIVGADETPMVFERDIVWISFPGKRQTEKWLHDTWLAQQH